MCFNMHHREIRLSEACRSPRLPEIMPANLLNGKNIMQHKRNLSNSKAFTQLRKFKFIETHTGDKEVPDDQPSQPYPGYRRRKSPGKGQRKGQRAGARTPDVAGVLLR